MSPTLIGYFPKRITRRPDWLKSPHVEEICSVSQCISKGPDGWIDQWRHNVFWVYDSQELAWSVVPVESRDTFHLYAYRLFPVRFDKGKQVPVELSKTHVEPLPASFGRLGFDAVSRSLDTTYECSPLSCNYMADHRKVNVHCLVETEAEGFEMALDFSVTEPEPGPYYLLEVWRHNSGDL